jgi:hypothetical protein
MKPTRLILAAAVMGAATVLPALEAHAQASTVPPAQKSAVKQRTFATAGEAAAALAEALRAQSPDQLLAVIGPGSASWLFSGDVVADRNDWKTFLAAYDQRNEVEMQGEAKAALKVGRDDWPFPAPIVKRGARWAFDSAAGREEIINRRVGHNELNTIQTLLAVVDAQREYAASDADGNGFADYARRLRSSPGKKDGLYWAQEAGKPQSPLGPLIAVAAAEGYGQQVKSQERAAYHGYRYRLLTSQGKDAPGGAYDYLVGDKLLGGFGVVAYPASYRASGVMTFIVNHEGVVFEKDLGPQTASIAGAMTRFNPDATWRRAP